MLVFSFIFISFSSFSLLLFHFSSTTFDSDRYMQDMKNLQNDLYFADVFFKAMDVLELVRKRDEEEKRR